MTTSSRHNQAMARSGFTPPPHENAEAHSRVMARLKNMSRQDLIDSGVRAGILTPEGQLTDAYRSPGENVATDTNPPKR